LPLLGRIGIRVRCHSLLRGYYPRGGGEVEVAVEPAALKPLDLDAPGRLIGVEGLAHVANLPLSIAERMRGAALAALGDPGKPVAIDARALGRDEAIGTGGAIACWARTQHGVLGAGSVAERGVRAEALGEAAGTEIAADLAAEAGLDVHAADQILIYLALAGGGFSTRRLSSHALTAMWLIEQFMPVRFDVASGPGLARVRVVRR
jgi:RNA 3'-terminal phosphate cyclase (ATP)